MDLGAGGDSARRKMDLAGEVTEVVPLEMYDSARAKIAANLRWLFAKAYGIGKLPRLKRNLDVLLANKQRLHARLSAHLPLFSRGRRGYTTHKHASAAVVLCLMSIHSV